MIYSSLKFIAMSNDRENSIGEGMFIRAIFGLIVGQVIAGCLEMKGFALPIFFAIVGAVIPFFSNK